MTTQTKIKNLASVHFSAHGQKIEDIHKVVEFILGQAGCRTCGRIAQLNVSFHGDPPEELAKLGVTSITHE
jgi:hypothetical protein